jgi:hypothetical protein
VWTVTYWTEKYWTNGTYSYWTIRPAVSADPITFWTEKYWTKTYWTKEYWTNYGAFVPPPSGRIFNYVFAALILRFFFEDEMITSRMLAEHTKSFTDTASDLSLTGKADMLILTSKDAGCRFSFGGDATSGSPYIPEDGIIVLFVDRPTVISVIRSDLVSGQLSVIENQLRVYRQPTETEGP